MRKVPGVDSSLIYGIAGSTIRTEDSPSCSETGSTAVSSRLKAKLGLLAVGGRGTKDLNESVSRSVSRRSNDFAKDSGGTIAHEVIAVTQQTFQRGTQCKASV